MSMKQFVKLIGIGFQIQRGLDLSVLESPRFQKSRLSGTFPVPSRRRRAESLAPRGGRQRRPVAFDLSQRRVDERFADAPITKLRTYFRGSLAPARAAVDKLLRKTRFIQKPFLLQPVEHLVRQVFGVGASQKFPAQLQSAVLAAGKQIQSLLAAGATLFLQWVFGRFRLA